MSSRTLIAALVAVLILGAATGTVLATGAQEDNVSAQLLETNGTTNSLGPAETTAEGYTETGLDVGTAIAADAQKLHTTHDRLTFEEQFNGATETTEQREVVEDTIRDIERESRSIEQRQAEVYEGYGNGTIDRNELVRSLLRLNAVAERQEERINSVVQTVSASPDISLRSDTEDRIDAINSNPILRTPPVEERLRTATDGTGDPVVAYAQSDGDALVLATISGNTHLRQANVLSEQDGSGIDQFGTADAGWFDAANERVAVLYPWAWTNLEGGGGDILSGLPYYFVDIRHPHGTLELFFDGTNENVFREHQINDASAIPTTESARDTTETVEVAVETTYPTGPMRIAVSDPASDAPVIGAITVNDQHIGVTDDGQLRAVQPVGEFTVEVATPDGETLTLDVSPDQTDDDEVDTPDEE